jgi:UPF0716 protein FxsA
VPTRELLDGLVVLIGGVLICVPGFIGDALGLMLMVRPVRSLVIRLSGLRLANRVGSMRTGRFGVINVDARPTSATYVRPSGMLDRPREHEDATDS